MTYAFTSFQTSLIARYLPRTLVWSLFEHMRVLPSERKAIRQFQKASLEREWTGNIHKNHLPEWKEIIDQLDEKKEGNDDCGLLTFLNSDCDFAHQVWNQLRERDFPYMENYLNNKSKEFYLLMARWNIMEQLVSFYHHPMQEKFVTGISADRIMILCNKMHTLLNWINVSVAKNDPSFAQIPEYYQIYKEIMPIMADPMLKISTRSPFLTICCDFMPYVFNRNARMMVEFLAYGANVDTVDDEENTALILCSQLSWGKKFIEILLANHADINKKNKSGQNAMSAAREHYLHDVRAYTEPEKYLEIHSEWQELIAFLQEKEEYYNFINSLTFQPKLTLEPQLLHYNANNNGSSSTPLSPKNNSF